MVNGLENHKRIALQIGEGTVISLEFVGAMIRQILRDDFWCRLEGQGGYVHLGWDFYMYIGVPHGCRQRNSLPKN